MRHKIVLFILMFANSCVPSYAKSFVPTPVKAPKLSFDKQVIQKTFDFIAEKEGFLPKYKTDLGHKETIIGYGDDISKKKYKKAKFITEKQAKECSVIVIKSIYVKLKKRLPQLNVSQYVALISLIYSTKEGSFYNSRLLQLLKTKSKNRGRIMFEWLDFNRVNHKVVDGLTNCRLSELNLFLKN